MLVPGTTLGPYRILASLGAGGMGEVYRARDTRLDRDVAVKVIPTALARDPDRVRRFEQEARAAGALNHPNVCAILDIGTHDGTPFVVEELLEGESLRHRLEKGPIPARKAIEYAAQAAHGLAAAHEKGIVHRDMKPENLFVTKDGRVKVLDFGLAKLTRHEVLAPTGQATVSIAATETGAILGTVGYMAPEQVRGEPADARSDIFALGAILYEMLTGKRAFQGTSHVETLASILNDEPQPLSASGRETPPGLEAIVRHCLEKNPEERFQSARDVAFDLEGLSGAGAVSSAALHAPVRAGRWRGRATVIRIGLGAALLALGFLAGARLMTTRRPEPPSFTRLTFQRGVVGNARFTPDGKSVLYSADWEGRPTEVFETQTDLSTSRSLGLSGIWLQAISRTGELALTRRASWFSPSFVALATAPKVGAAPRDVLEDVAVADWSADGKTLAVVRRQGGEVRLEMPPGRVLVSTSGSLGNVRVSRDGRRIAFTEHPVVGDSRGTVAVVDEAGRKTTLTDEFTSVLGLAWSPNGREIWFGADEKGMRGTLFAITPDGRLRKVARFPSYIRLYDVAPDGRVLLVSRRIEPGIRGRSASDTGERELGWLDYPILRTISADGKKLLLNDEGATASPTYTVYLRDMDGSPAVRLGEGATCALSPDGRWVLAIRYGPPHQLILIPTGSGETRSLPRGRLDTYQPWASWLPDGKGIVFVGAEAGRLQRTWIQELPDGLPSPVTPEGVVGATVSPDGRMLAAENEDFALMLYPLGAGEPRSLTKLGRDEGVTQWSGDGRALLVARGTARLDAFAIDVRSGERRPWRSFEMPDPAGARLYGLVVTPDERSYAYGYFRVLDELYLVDGLR